MTLMADCGSVVPAILKKVGRAPSLKGVAAVVKSNVRANSMRASILAAAAAQKANDSGSGGNSPLDRRASTAGGLASSFAGVAHQVVTSQRAAKGFLAMWARDTTAQVHVYKGIHMEKKKLDLKTVAAEYKEMKRRQFYQELIVYVMFLLLLFSLLGWLPVQDSYQQNDVVGALTCREDEVCELKKFGDVYEFAGSLNEQLCQRKDVTAQWTRIGGVRFRQVRVREEQCKVYNGWSVPCYPNYDTSVEQMDPIEGHDGRVYTWSDDLGLLEPRLHTLLETFATTHDYGNGGYTVDLCAVNVDDLQEDDWLSVSTRAFSIDFILMNPVTRIFTIGSHVFTMSPSGHMKHYPQSANLRVVGLEENELFPSATDTQQSIWVDFMPKPDDNSLLGQLAGMLETAIDVVSAPYRSMDNRVVLWCALVIFFITYAMGEFSEMSTMGAGTYLKSDMWNVFELMHLVVLFLVLTCMARYYFASQAFGKHLVLIMSGREVDELDHSDVHDLLYTFQQLSDLASLTSAISLLKIFKFLRMNSTLNLLWRVLGMAMRDLMGFLVIFNLIFLGYSTMGSFAFGFALEEFSTISKSYATCFHMLAGEMDYPRLRQANPRLAPVFIVTFIVLVFQILVNMFVAILSEYYEVAKNDEGCGEDVEYDVLTRFRNYLKACSPTVVTKKNEVIRLFAHQQVRLISTNLVDQEETRQRAKKLFRGAVWRVVALLRFGVKFDRRINFGDRKHTSPAAAAKQNKMTSHIRLSENFDHKTIKEMIPTGITIRLQGESLLGDNGLALKVLRHNKLSVECVVLGPEEDQQQPPRSQEGAEPAKEKVLELLGGEKLRIPWQLFVYHVLKGGFKEVRMGFMRAMKLWNYSKTHLVDDYHLWLLFESVREDGRASLRYDEVYRMLDLYLRKDRRKSSCTQAEVRHEALQVMYRFRKCLIDMPSREKEGHNYRPKPVDTTTIELGPLEHLGDMLAQNCHDMWALERLKQGWSYGAQRDDAKKRHPNLVPYDLLSPNEQAFDHRSSVETLKTILFMNYTIVRASNSGSFQEQLSRSMSTVSDEPGSNTPASLNRAGSIKPEEPVSPTGGKAVPSLRREAMLFRRNSLMDDSPYFVKYGEDLKEVYRPLPIDTTSIELPARLLRLVDLLAENAHEVWSKGRMDEGWSYGPQRDDKAKKHPCLVPYIFLTDDEKEYDINIAKETLKTLLAMKFTLIDRSSK
ncbi:TPA: hypothetical protein N0F65_005335 [Lagenidium giganteum]|uniref:Uncharacterized protein n=1 Tax=Lagenidium giganteum TaxID=4803 RepID=A0AAV2YXT0_9STRA|nr:TPA: hypothetical protein N0F65_005335 [Lagenidium giganteum]